MARILSYYLVLLVLKSGQLIANQIFVIFMIKIIIVIFMIIQILLFESWRSICLTIIHFTPSSKGAVLYGSSQEHDRSFAYRLYGQFQNTLTRLNITNSQLQWKDIPLGENL